MWENRCKVAVSGVGLSNVTRSAEIPLAAHALTAVKEAVADSGLKISDIDGLATYPELPATGHAEIDGISIVSVNCMMAMLKLPNLSWHIQVGTTNVGGAVQQAVNGLLAGVCRYAVVWRAMHNPGGTYQNLPDAQAHRAAQFTPPCGFGAPGDAVAGGSSSAKLTWERSGFGPQDVYVAQIYDGFSASVIYGLESYGFCPEGTALDFIQDGRIELDGELPLNTFGGSLGTGRIHGLWHIIEGALQASGRAGSRQVKDANVSFVGASAPIVTGTTFIFVREPY